MGAAWWARGQHLTINQQGPDLFPTAYRGRPTHHTHSAGEPFRWSEVFKNHQEESPYQRWSGEWGRVVVDKDMLFVFSLVNVWSLFIIGEIWKLIFCFEWCLRAWPSKSQCTFQLALDEKSLSLGLAGILLFPYQFKYTRQTKLCKKAKYIYPSRNTWYAACAIDFTTKCNEP